MEGKNVLPHVKQAVAAYDCASSFCSQWQIQAEVAVRLTFCQEQELDLQNVASSTPVQPLGTLDITDTSTSSKHTFLRKRMFGGGHPFYLKLWVNRPPLQ